MNKNDLYDVLYDIQIYAAENYDNALNDTSFERDFAELLDGIHNIDSISDNVEYDKEYVIEFLTLIRDGINKWLNKNKR